MAISRYDESAAFQMGKGPEQNIDSLVWSELPDKEGSKLVVLVWSGRVEKAAVDTPGHDLQAVNGNKSGQIIVVRPR
jgi:hypothetical protein